MASPTVFSAQHHVIAMIAPISTPVLDEILTLQLAVAWAGESGESPRLKWWRTDLVSEYGGIDLFRQLLPATWRWAVLEAAREAARRADATQRGRDHDPDQLYTLFRFGFEFDERLDERLAQLKASGVDPEEALPSLAGIIAAWNADAFELWLSGLASVETTAAPAGRLIRGGLPAEPVRAATLLAAGLLPLGETYSMPHFKRAP